MILFWLRLPNLWIDPSASCGGFLSSKCFEMQLSVGFRSCAARLSDVYFGLCHMEFSTVSNSSLHVAVLETPAKTTMCGEHWSTWSKTSGHRAETTRGTTKNRIGVFFPTAIASARNVNSNSKSKS